MHPGQYKDTVEFFTRDCPHLSELAYGHSGIGKSEIPVQVAEEIEIEGKDGKVTKGVPLIYLDCTGMEPTDLIGLPDNRTDDKFTLYKPPEFFRKAVEEPRGILILDEVTRLDMQVRHTVMQLLVRREIGSVKLNPGWHIVMTANPADAEYQVAELDVAYRRRSVIFPVSYNLDAWQQWAVHTGEVHPRVIGVSGRLSGGLHKNIDKKIEQTFTPYGLKAASDLFKAGIMEKLDQDVAFAILAGAVGDVAAKSLMESINDEELKKLVDAVMNCSKDLKNLPHDKAIALVCAVWEKVNKQCKKYVPQIKNLYDQLNMDIRMMLIKLCYTEMSQNIQEFRPLIEEWSTWCTEQAKAKQKREQERRKKEQGK